MKKRLNRGLIFLAFLVVLVLGVVYGYSRKHQGIVEAYRPSIQQSLDGINSYLQPSTNLSVEELEAQLKSWFPFYVDKPETWKPLIKAFSEVKKNLADQPGEREFVIGKIEYRYTEAGVDILTLHLKKGNQGIAGPGLSLVGKREGGQAQILSLNWGDILLQSVSKGGLR